MRALLQPRPVTLGARPVAPRSLRAGRSSLVVRAEVESKSASIGEKEQMFLEALRSFYFDGKSNMSNEEFDQLKQDLLWEGSKVAVLTSDEQRFLEASMAFEAGKPIMNDTEYDGLKRKLLEKGSDITVQGPRCSLRTGKMYADAVPDYARMLTVNVPAALIVLGLVFAVDYLTNFSITYLVELPKPFGFLFLWVFLFPSIYALSSGITSFVLRDWVIVKAPCPNCGAESNAFFGDIFTVAGPRLTNDVECSGCQSLLRFDNAKRNVTVERVGPAPAPAGKKGGKKAESA